MMTSHPVENSAGSASSSSFVPRPFPPTSLRDVPEEYIILQLHRLAHNYWSKPETADCTLIVPIDIGQQLLSQESVVAGPSSARYRSGRGGLATVENRRIVFKLHQDYLASQSTFMRRLLSGSDPLSSGIGVNSPADQAENDASTSSAQSSRQPTPRPPASALSVPTPRRPHILPSSTANHPIILLPVPDSKSLPHLIRYIYFGTFDHIEECLHRGGITWQGIVQNVEYLGMRVELKASLGRYYRQWMAPSHDDPYLPEMEDSDSEDSTSVGSNESGGSYGSDTNADVETERRISQAVDD